MSPQKIQEIIKAIAYGETNEQIADVADVIVSE